MSSICRWVIRLLALLVAAPVLAGGIEVGARLPDLVIDDRGEMVLAGDDLDFLPWHYPQEPGVVHIVQYMAATSAAGDMNKPFRDRLSTDLPQGGFRTTTILNMDDAIWGTGGFVMSELKSNKRQFPDAVLVVDEDGVGIGRWQLERDNSAVMVVDPQGTVLYFRQGAMSPAEVDSTLKLILEQIQRG